ncbi:MAG: ester cyclase [Anaerolineales bacterium]|nr:ester cyclase [Anaerolineales bacterium]
MTHPTLSLISAYVAALAAGDSAAMHDLRAADFVLDWAHGDAFEDAPLSAEATQSFWPAWFAAFPEMDYEVTRTVAAADVVVTEWIFTGTHARPLGPPVFDPPQPPGQRTIRFRGVSVYEVANGRIQRETTYLDLATLMVELGVTP